MWWLGSVAVVCQTYDCKVMGLTFGQVKWLLIGLVIVCRLVNYLEVYNQPTPRSVWLFISLGR